jgi:hypothetical protein
MQRASNATVFMKRSTKDLRRQYAASLLVSAAVAAAVLSGMVLFVWWAGWGGAVGILSAAGVFLWWFYRGKRPDLDPRKD